MPGFSLLAALKRNLKAQRFPGDSFLLKDLGREMLYLGAVMEKKKKKEKRNEIAVITDLRPRGREEEIKSQHL
ncbi:Nedd4-Binding Protein 2-Like 2 [Manis pentadactyla]|nr:Nedd4-Binding Protein 2-Like 2 [Manis pentadactyla]